MYVCVYAYGLSDDSNSQFNTTQLEQTNKQSKRLSMYMSMFTHLASKCVYVHIDNEVPVCLVSPGPFPEPTHYTETAEWNLAIDVDEANYRSKQASLTLSH